VSARTPRPISLLGAFALLLVGALGVVLTLGVAIGVYVMRHGATMAEASDALRADILLVALAQLVGSMLAIGAGFAFVFGEGVRVRDALDVRPVPTAVVMLAVTAGLALQFPLSELANLLGRIDPSFGMDEAAEEALRRMIRVRSVRDAIVIPLAVIAIPAVTEELLFRGLLLPGLARRYGAAAGLALSSVLFGLVHAVPVAIVYAAIAGAVLGLVRMRTRSVLPCIAMHGAFNAVPVLLPAELVRIEGFNTAGDGMYHLPLPLTVGSALVAALAVVTMARLTETDRA
jgi:membrane protease YdiL (CAAX protease family)